ncbi:hypothetical protein BRADI_3g51781v3 [Brachypodium distachyon]|uniref:Uncharacterized protein n=1 Tax=Brachypodium distachyon TaxID=15368 RepID=A0A2K2D4N7_BRADI|nr:hypothetical protein BRADI_3g51781v3 [Brachypodium distachyon]
MSRDRRPGIPRCSHAGQKPASQSHTRRDRRRAAAPDQQLESPPRNPAVRHQAGQVGRRPDPAPNTHQRRIHSRTWPPTHAATEARAALGAATPANPTLRPATPALRPLRARPASLEGRAETAPPPPSQGVHGFAGTPSGGGSAGEGGRRPLGRSS